jgi:hypothetical protein
MTYATELADISRKPISLVVMTLDYCAETYGVLPCNATTNLIPNGSVWTGATGVTPPTGYTNGTHGGIYTIFDSGDGYAHDACLKIEVNAVPDSDPYLRLHISDLVIGTIYRFSFDFKHGDGTSGLVYLGTAVDANDIKAWAVLTDATWTTHTHIWTATATDLYVSTAAMSGTTGQYELFDSFTLCENANYLPCYNTFPTCLDKPHYNKSSKDYKFTPNEMPLPFKAGERPYLKGISYLATKIGDNLTVTGRTKIELYDDLELTDVGVDPYYATRTTVQGTFWKKFIARNRNFKGRPVKIYEGFEGLTEAEFLAQPSWNGIIDTVSLDKGVIKIDVVDTLKKLSDIDVPAKDNIKVDSIITAAATVLTMSTLADISSSGFVRIGDEIIGFGTFSSIGNFLSDCTRGEFGSIATTHSTGAKVQRCRYYPLDDPFTHIQNILSVDAGIPASQINTSAFTHAATWPSTDVQMSALISEPKKVSDIYYGLVKLVDCKTWVNEDLKITIARNIGNAPSQTYTTWTDSENFIYESAGVDMNEESRITRCSLYWDMMSTGDDEKPSDFNRLNIAIDVNAESSKEYNDTIEDITFTRWINSSAAVPTTQMNQYANNMTARRMKHHRDALPILSVSVERKDADVRVGSKIKVTTDEINTIDGSDFTGRFQVIERKFGQSKSDYKLMQLPRRRTAFITDATQGYTSASDAEKEYGHICSSGGFMSNQEEGYYIW